MTKHTNKQKHTITASDVLAEINATEAKGKVKPRREGVYEVSAIHTKVVAEIDEGDVAQITVTSYGDDFLAFIKIGEAFIAFSYGEGDSETAQKVRAWMVEFLRSGRSVDKAVLLEFMKALGRLNRRFARNWARGGRGREV